MEGTTGITRGEADDASRQADEAGTAAKFPVPGE